MIKINLIPPEYIAKINRRVVIAKVALAAVVVVASVIMASLWHIGRAKAVETKLADLERQMQELQKDVDRAKEIEKQIAEVQRYLNSINSINKGRFTYTHFMQDIVADLPGTLWFNGLNTSVAGNALNISMTVNSNSAYDLAYWINSLETSGPYSAVTVGAISVSDSDLGKTFRVPISAKYALK